MNEFEKIDVQCEKIFNGITQLEKYIQEPIAKEALELGINSNATNNEKLLRGIKKSLLQYKERGKDLVYIGLMGHFSTGKSSTINSLLDLDKNSNSYREIGLNPVDKDITLVTHSENNDSIFKVTREGLVSIRVSFIDHDFIKNIVLADTPGTGDPEDFKDIAKDFLPICDLILYFFSATNPLNQADVPLLKEKRSQLEFIPMKFIVTRADEFRIDENSKLTPQNFDELKAASFKGALIQRINQIINTSISERNSSDIFIVDTKADFNISELKKFILDFSDISNSSIKIQIHSHKVDYFRSSSEKIKASFCDFLSTKLANVSSIVETAKNNIESFHNKIQVTNNELTESWNKRLKEIQNLSIKLPNENPGYFCRYYTLEGISATNQTVKTFRLQLIKEVAHKAGLLAENMKLESLAQLEAQFYQIRDEIGKSSIDSVNIYEILRFNDFKIERKETEEGKINSNFLPSDIVYENARMGIREVHSCLTTEFNTLVKCVEKLNNDLALQIPIKSFRKTVEEAAQNLSFDIDIFFSSVMLYRSAVFSLKAKEAITKLGLGQRMDILEAQNLTEDEKETIKRRAQDYIFEHRNEIFEESLLKFSVLQKEVHEFYLELKELGNKKLVSDKGLAEIPQEWVSGRLTELNNEMIQEIEFNINNGLISSINLNLYRRVNELIVQGNKSIERLRRERRNRLLFIIISFCSVATTVYSAYIFTAQKNVPNDLFSTVLIGIGINLVSAPLANFLGKITDSFPREIKKKKEEIINSIGLVCQEIVKENMESFKSEVSSESKFPELMQNFWEELLLDKPLRSWFQANQEFFTLFKQSSSRFSRLQQEYLSLSDSLSSSVSSYFSDPKNNLEKLDEFTSSLKEKSIEPSFSLLNHIEEELKVVSSKIKEVKFW